MDKDIRPGPYRRYDGREIRVILTAPMLGSEEVIVICRDGREEYAVTRASFLSLIRWEGTAVPRYRPLEAQKEVRLYRNSGDYLSYAKDLCEHFAEDFRRCKLCAEEKRLIGITKEDYAAAREDIAFLNTCLKTTLAPYNDLFRGRFLEGQSIRGYAAASGRNRGSVEHLQRKFYAALSQALEDRDKAEGLCRLKQSKEERNQ